MSDNNTVFDDIMQGLHEIEDYQKGNIQLKSTIVTIPDDEIEHQNSFIIKYNRLPDKAKQELENIVDKMLAVSNQ